MPSHGYKDHAGLPTNSLTGLVDAEALDRFAKTLPRDRGCPIFGHLARLRRTYRLLARQLRKKELRRWRYENWVKEYS